MNGFEELLEDEPVETTNPRTSLYGQSPAQINRDLMRDLGIKERKASVLN